MLQVSAVAISERNQLYAAASMMGAIAVYSLETGDVVDQFSVSPAAVGALSFLEMSGGALLLIGTYHGQVHMRNVAKQNTPFVVEFDAAGRDVSHPPRYNDSTRRTDSAKGGGSSRTPATPAAGVVGGKVVDGCGGSSSGDATAAGAERPRLPHSEETASPSQVLALAVSRAVLTSGRDGKEESAVIAVGGKLARPPDYVEIFTATRPTPRVLDLSNGRRGSSSSAPIDVTLRARVRTIGTLTRSVSIDDDGTMLVAGGDARCVQMWSMRRMRAGATGGREAEWIAPKPEVEFRCASAIQSLALSPSGAMLAVGLSSHTEIYTVSTDTVAAALFERGVGEEWTSGGPPFGSQLGSQLGRCGSAGDTGGASHVNNNKLRRETMLSDCEGDEPPPLLSRAATGRLSITDDDLSPSSPQDDVGRPALPPQMSSKATNASPQRGAACNASSPRDGAGYRRSRPPAVTLQNSAAIKGSTKGIRQSFGDSVCALAKTAKLSPLRQPLGRRPSRVVRQETGSSVRTAEYSAGGGTSRRASEKGMGPLPLMRGWSMDSFRTQYTPSTHVATDPLFEITPLLMLTDCKCELPLT